MFSLSASESSEIIRFSAARSALDHKLLGLKWDDIDLVGRLMVRGVVGTPKTVSHAKCAGAMCDRAGAVQRVARVAHIGIAVFVFAFIAD
jgi:hypothetical protein